LHHSKQRAYEIKTKASIINQNSK